MNKKTWVVTTNVQYIYIYSIRAKFFSTDLNSLSKTNELHSYNNESIYLLHCLYLLDPIQSCRSLLPSFSGHRVGQGTPWTDLQSISGKICAITPTLTHENFRAASYLICMVFNSETKQTVTRTHKLTHVEYVNFTQKGPVESQAQGSGLCCKPNSVNQLHHNATNDKTNIWKPDDISILGHVDARGQLHWS